MGGAIETLLGPSSLLEERSEIPVDFVVSFVLSATPPKLGETAKVYRSIDDSLRDLLSLFSGLGLLFLYLLLIRYTLRLLPFSSAGTYSSHILDIRSGCHLA